MEMETKRYESWNTLLQDSYLFVSISIFQKFSFVQATVQNIFQTDLDRKVWQPANIHIWDAGTS